jgi:hypothetical protein
MSKTESKNRPDLKGKENRPLRPKHAIIGTILAATTVLGAITLKPKTISPKLVEPTAIEIVSSSAEAIAMKHKQDQFVAANKKEIDVLLNELAWEDRVQYSSDGSLTGNYNPKKKDGEAYFDVNPGYSLTNSQKELFQKLINLKLIPDSYADFLKERESNLENPNSDLKIRDSGEKLKVLKATPNTLNNKLPPNAG